MRKRFIYQEHDIYIAEHRIIGKLHILQPRASIENDIADQVELTEQLQDRLKFLIVVHQKWRVCFQLFKEWQLLSFCACSR